MPSRQQKAPIDPAELLTLEQLAELLQQLVARKSYTSEDVLTLDQLSAALHISKRHIFRILPKLPVSYGLGDRAPRVIYGDVLEYLRRTIPPEMRLR